MAAKPQPNKYLATKCAKYKKRVIPAKAGIQKHLLEISNAYIKRAIAITG